MAPECLLPQASRLRSVLENDRKRSFMKTTVAVSFFAALTVSVLVAVLQSGLQFTVSPRSDVAAIEITQEV